MVNAGYTARSAGTPPQGRAMFRIDFNKLRFLVCDDNPHMRRILRTLLHSFGAREVYEAEDGASALEMYTHYVPDIVITDWAMPIFDGLELAQMIRQPESEGKLLAPIIMLRGHSEERRVTVARAEPALAGPSGEFKGWIIAEATRLSAAPAALRPNGFTTAACEELFRAAHDIKGDAATFGYPYAGMVAESLCR